MQTLATFNTQALTTTEKQTMSSREIAELTGKQHNNVKRDVAVMLDSLNLGALRFEHTYLDSWNRQQTEYLLDKELTLCLVAGYDAKLRMTIIKRWNELENQAAKPMTQIQILAQQAQALADMEQQQLAQGYRLEEVEFKTEYLSEEVGKVVSESETLNKRIAQIESEGSERKPWESCPTNCYNKTALINTINQRHGLPKWVIEEVLNTHPDAPNSEGYVINQHPSAAGQKYLVWNKVNITAFFKKFIQECEAATPTKASHYLLDKPFKCKF